MVFSIDIKGLDFGERSEARRRIVLARGSAKTLRGRATRRIEHIAKATKGKAKGAKKIKEETNLNNLDRPAISVSQVVATPDRASSDDVR
jgi:hypothetical protein